jgi:hypothetical protein
MGYDRQVMGSHADTVLSRWRDRGGASTSALLRAGLGLEECNEIDENLARLVEE